MKKLLTLSLLLFLLVFGCNQETDVTSPSQSENHSYQLIKLPPKSGLYVETTFSKTETIDAEYGGEIKIKEDYVAADGHTVKIDAKLKVMKNSFTGIVDITMSVDDEYAAVSFTPAMVFREPAELNLKFEGLDLNNLEVITGDYEFVYISDNWDIEQVTYNSMHVNESQGKISVKDADINHFSKYGWIR